MAYIKVDFAGLYNTKTSLEKISKGLGTAQTTVCSVIDNLDWDVACEENIKNDLHDIVGRLETARRRMTKSYGVVESADMAYRNAEYSESAVLNLKFAKSKAVTVDDSDPAMFFLGCQRKENEKFGRQLSAYTYELLTLDPSDFAKKMIPGSKEVNAIRENAIKNSIASVISSSSACNSSISSKDVENVFMSVSDITLSGVDTFKDTNLGTAFGIAKFIHECGVDVTEYGQLSPAEQVLLASSAYEKNQTQLLLSELMETYADDELLVKCCKDLYSDIENSKGGLLNEVKRFAKENDELMSKFANNTTDYTISVGTDYLAGMGGGFLAVPALAAKGVAFLGETFLGSDTNIHTLENLDIIHNEIQNSSALYNQAVENGASLDALKFRELYMLNMKMEGLEMSKNLNKRFFNQPDTDYINNINGISDSYKKAYDTIVLYP